MYENKIKQIDILKKEIAQIRPLKPQVLKQLKEYYKIGLTYSSNALEGNSLTETETKIVLEEGITIGGKLLKDHYEAAGHAQAYDYIFQILKKDKIEEEDILQLHKLFYYRIDIENAGKYRKDQVYITGTDFMPPKPELVPLLMKEFVQNLPEDQKKYHEVEFAALLHLNFVTIHPFVDGNGRCARLLMNLALLKAGYVVTVIPPILRNDYISSIKKAQTTKDNTVFINFISNMVYEGMKDYLRLIGS